jgi:hypothetical protein
MRWEAAQPRRRRGRRSRAAQGGCPDPGPRQGPGGHCNEEIPKRGVAATEDRGAIEAKLAAARRKLARLYDALESGMLTLEDLAPRIQTWREKASSLEDALQELDQASGKSPIEVDDRTIREYVAGLRDLLTRGDLDARRQFLRTWIKRIEVNGYKLTIEYGFPTGGGGGGAEAGARVGLRDDDDTVALPRRSPRKRKAEPWMPGVLPMIANGSHWWTGLEPSAWSRAGRCG